MSSQASGERHCFNCKKPESQLRNPLKHCAKCKTQLCCSRECQKADWKKHKPSCGSFDSSKPPSTITAANGEQATANNARAEQGPCYMPKPFSALNDGTWLLDRPEEDVFKLLVDVYRMRVEDEYKFEGTVEEGTLYSGAGVNQALASFRRFLTKATQLDEEREKKMLPAWWSPSKLKECVSFACRDSFSNVGFAVEKSDIKEHYRAHLMPMQLRMFGEKLDGTLTAGMSSASMLSLQIMIEQSNMPCAFDTLSL